MARIIGRSTPGDARTSALRDWQVCAARMDNASAARSKAATLLLHARAQARAIIVSAQATAQEVAAGERQQAWDRGYADGVAQAQAEMTELRQRLTTLVANADIAHQASTLRLDEDALSLILALTRTLVKHEVHTSAETILHVVRDALREMSLDTEVVLRVHPDDEAVLQSQVPLLDLPTSTSVTVTADPAVTRGGCLVESGAGCVDATIETQLERLDTLLREYLHAA